MATTSTAPSGYAPHSLCATITTRSEPCSRIDVRTIRSTKSRSVSHSGAANAFAPPGIFTWSNVATPRRLRNLRTATSKRASKQVITQASAL